MLRTETSMAVPVGLIPREDVEAELVQYGLEGDRRGGRELVAQGQGPLCRQLRHETVRQRLHDIVVLVFRRGCLTSHGDDRTPDHGRRGRAAIRTDRGTGVVIRLELHRPRLVLRTDIAAIDRQRPLRSRC